MNIDYIKISETFSTFKIIRTLGGIILAYLMFGFVFYGIGKEWTTKRRMVAGTIFMVLSTFSFFSYKISGKYGEYYNLPKKYKFSSYSKLKRNIKHIKEATENTKEIPDKRKYINRTLTQFYLNKDLNTDKEIIQKLEK